MADPLKVFLKPEELDCIFTGLLVRTGEVREELLATLMGGDGDLKHLCKEYVCCVDTHKLLVDFKKL